MSPYVALLGTLSQQDKQATQTGIDWFPWQPQGADVLGLPQHLVVAKVLGISWLVDMTLLCQPLSSFDILLLLGLHIAFSKGHQALALGPTFAQHDLILTN